METAKSFATQSKFLRSLVPFLFLLTILINGCQNDNITEPSYLSEDEYLRTTAINSAFSSDTDDDDNLFSNEVDDFDALGPITDNVSGFDTPIDSLIKWGRRVTGVNINSVITVSSDSMKTVEVTRTISGNFIIIGYIGGVLDSTSKPYVQEQKRIVIFKRVQRRPNPRFNWRVYQHSAVDGQTTSPQTGKSNIIMSKVEFYRNNQLVLTLNGPDFTTNLFTSRHFGGTRLIEVDRGDQIKTLVYLNSNQPDTDYVSYHWARNSFGFHREKFELISQTPGGNGFDRIYEKTYTIYSQHHGGIHNGFISANTHKSLYDNDPSLFSSTYMGLPYRVRH